MACRRYPLFLRELMSEATFGSKGGVIRQYVSPAAISIEMAPRIQFIVNVQSSSLLVVLDARIMFSLLRKGPKTLRSTAGSNPIPSSRHVKSTTSTPQSQHQNRKKDLRRLKLPSYASVDEIRHSCFVDELRRENPDHTLRGRDVKNALRCTIINMVGKKRFQRLKKSRSTDELCSPWQALMQESREFWDKKPPKGRSGRKR